MLILPCGTAMSYPPPELYHPHSLSWTSQGYDTIGARNIGSKGTIFQGMENEGVGGGHGPPEADRQDSPVLPVLSLSKEANSREPSPCGRQACSRQAGCNPWIKFPECGYSR